MYPLGAAGFLIALVATAGAIPLFRNLSRQSRPGVEDVLVRAVPPVAGAAMLFGVFLSLFYLDVSLWPAVDLLVIGACLAGLGFVLEQTRETRKFWHSGLGYEMLAAFSAALGILFVSRNTDAHWTPSVVVVALLIAATPGSLSSLARLPRATPALPTGVCLVQFSLLALLGALGVSGGVAGTVAFDDFSAIALPLCGAAIGSLIYLCRMPWRPEAAITTSLTARLCLGLAVAWGASKLWKALDADPHALAAIAWILAVPVLEVMRLVAGECAGNLFPAFRTEAAIRVLKVAHSPVLITSFVLALGVTGIALWRAGISETASLALLPPALLAYLVWTALMRPLTSSHRATFLDAGG